MLLVYLVVMGINEDMKKESYHKSEA